ncbi:MAG: NMD3-related protein [Candidatus Nezhaarchaeales archaeon]
MERFCARCGAKIGFFETAKLRNLCSRCYLEVYKADISLREVSLTLCRKCLSVKFKGLWLPLDLSSEEEVIEKFIYVIKSEVERACKLETSLTLTSQEVYKILSGERITLIINFREKVHPSLESIEESRSLEVKPRFSICPVCLKMVGKSFEATIQLRGFSSKELEQIKAIVNRVIVERSGGSHNIRTSAIWEEVDGGVDVKLPSTDLARKIANIVKKSFGVKVKESYKDSGWDKSRGKPLRKLTILLRFRNA